MFLNDAERLGLMAPNVSLSFSGRCWNESYNAAGATHQAIDLTSVGA